jgi:asparagine N-glycosylation enzyme membrane subunit Stt3
MCTSGSPQDRAQTMKEKSMIARDKGYLVLAILCLILQASTIPITKFLGDTMTGFYTFWFFVSLILLVPAIIIVTSSRSFIATSRYAALAVVISMTSLLLTLGYSLLQ